MRMDTAEDLVTEALPRAMQGLILVTIIHFDEKNDHSFTLEPSLFVCKFHDRL